MVWKLQQLISDVFSKALKNKILHLVIFCNLFIYGVFVLNFKAVVISNLHQQGVCGPAVDDAPAHLWPVSSVAIVTVDGVQTAAC